MGEGPDEDVATLSREELEERARALRSVLSVAEAIHRSRDFADMAERAVDAIVQYTRFPSVAIFKVNRAEGCVDVVAARGFSDEVMARAKRLPLEGSLTGFAVRTGLVMTSGDLGADKRVEPQTQAALQKDGYTEVASVPIFFREEVIGALNLIYRGDAGPTEHERSTLLTLGKTIGVAMQNRIDEDARRAALEQLRRAEQLERLGVLAAGIAHDFNNLLVGVIGNVSYAREFTAAAGKASLDDAEQSARRARDLAQQLLTFSRGGAPIARPTPDVAGIVRAAAELGVKGTGAGLEIDATDDGVVVIVDGAQLAQVVRHLVQNAAQASAPGGKVTVSLAREEAPRRLRVVVHDDGRGIPEAIRERIFEPYFTTKEKATGLGLAIVRSIVDRNGGTLELTSHEGRGTTFTARLAVDVAAASAPPTTAAPEAGARVLIVDDEAQVRTVARRILLRGGARVDDAEDGDRAVALFAEARREGKPYACVILDLTMRGGETGTQVLARLRAIDPEVCAIVSSGYSDDAAMAEPKAHGFAAVLPKPYTATELKNVVAFVIDGATTPA